MIVDIETHPLRFARIASANPQMSLTKHYTWCEQSADLLVAEMDYAGVDKAFLISYDAEDISWGSRQKGFDIEDFGGGRKYSLGGFHKHPKRFWWFNTLKDPKRHDASKLAQRDFDEGASGLKLFAAYVQADLMAPEWLSVFRLALEQDKRLLISFQTLRPPASFTLAEYLDQLDRLLTTLPDLKVILMQAGCVDPLSPAWDAVRRVADRHPALIMGCGFVGEVWDDETEYPFPNYLRRIERLAGAVGCDRMSWGTDWPWFEDKFKYRQGADAIRRHAHFLTSSQKADFLGHTAARFMGIDV